MDITKELGPILDTENAYIDKIKGQLAGIGTTLTDKSEHDLRMGFRTKAMVDIRLARHRATEQPA